MSSTYSTNLALELIGTGDQAGTWGNTTNTNLGTLIEQAISGYVTQAVSTGTDTTITIPNGATGVARNMYIELTGTGGTNTNLIVPANKKLYFIFNNASGAVTVKVSGQTGVSVPAGKKVVLASNGTDTVNALNYIADFGSNSATITQLTATSATITNLTLTSLVISNLSIASANITTLTSSSATISTTLALSGGTANGVLYLNGSKVATSGSALTYDGTTLTTGRINVTNTGTGATFSSSGGSGMRVYGSSGTNQWDVYLNSTNLRLSDNTGGGQLYVDTGAYFGGNVGIGTSSPASKFQVKVATNANVAFNDVSGVARLDFYNDAASANVNANIQFNNLFFRANGTIVSTLDSSGNLGLGVTPSLWRSTEKAIQIGSWMGLFTDSGLTTEVSYNNYINSSNQRIYQNTGYALRYQQYNGIHSWHTAPSGTAGNQITGANAFVQTMTLDASGNLGIGTSSPGFKLDVQGTTPAIRLKTAGVGTGFKIEQSNATGDVELNVIDGYPLIFKTNNTEGFRLTSSTLYTASGINVGIGTSSPAYKLDVTNSANANTTIGVTNSTSGTSALARFLAVSNAGNAFFGMTSPGYTDISSAADALVINASSASGGIVLAQDGVGQAWLNTSGNLGIGTSSPNIGGVNKAITVNSATSTNCSYELSVNNVLQGSLFTGISTSSVALYTVANGPLIFGTNNTERARISSDGTFRVKGAGTAGSTDAFLVDGAAPASAARITSGGEFYVNTTAAGGKFYVVSDLTANNGLRVDVPASFTASAIALFSATAAGTGWYFLTGESSGGSARIQILGTGDVNNANGTYGTISDARLKQDIVDAPSQWNDIKAIKFRKYRMKSDVEADPNAPALLGVVAQELAQVSPGLVDEHPNMKTVEVTDEEGNVTQTRQPTGTTTKTVKSSILLMKAAVALQEAMARIEKLEAEMALLKGA